MTNGTSNELAITMLRNQHVNGFSMVPTIGHHQQPAVPKAENEWLALIPEPFRDITTDNLPPPRMVDQTDVQ
jgi:hypothetical protein